MALNFNSGTIQVNGDSVVESTIFNIPTPKYVNIDEGVATADSATIPLKGTGSGSQAFLLGPMPSDFISIEEVTVRIRARFSGGMPQVVVKIVQSDGSTSLTTDSGNIVPLFSPTYNTVELSLVPSGAVDATTWDGAQLLFQMSFFDETTYGIQGNINAVEADVTYVAPLTETASGGAKLSGVATVFPWFGIGGATAGGSADVHSSVINIAGSGGALVGSASDGDVISIISGGCVVGGTAVESVFRYFGSGSFSLSTTDDVAYRATYFYNPDLDIPFVTNLGLVNGDGNTNSSIFAVAAPKYTFIDEVVPGNSSYIPLQGTGNGSQTFTFQNVPSNFKTMESITLLLSGQFLQFGTPEVHLQIMKANETTPLTGSTGNIVDDFVGTGIQTLTKSLNVLSSTNNAADWNGSVLRFDLFNFDAPTYGTQLFIDAVDVLATFLTTDDEGRVVLGSQTLTKVGYDYTGTGTIFISGTGALNTDQGIEITGEIIEISGEAEVRVEEFFDQKFLWNYKTRLILDKDFEWSTGQNRLSTFRILSRCTPNCEPFQDDCERRTLITLTARSVREVCRILTEQRFSFPIDEFDRLSVPPETASLEEDLANGILNDCIELIPEDFCEIPECFAFCVDFNLEQISRFDTFASLVLEFDYESDISDPIVISGYAPSEFRIRINVGVEEGSGGAVAAGEALIESSNNVYIATGGIAVGGDISGGVISSSWTYIGGAYPEIQGGFFGIASTAESSELLTVWTDPSRANRDDGTTTYAALAPDKPVSEILYLLNPEINIPEGSTILGIAVAMERWAASDTVATHLPVFDYEIKLVSDDVESENKAYPNYWPTLLSGTLDTFAIYGADFDTWGRTWTAEELNSDNFGIAISVAADLVEAIVAYIDAVQFEIYYYEDNSGRVELDGSAIQKASAYFAIGAGGMEVAGGITQPESHYSFIASGSMSLGGTYGQSESIEIEGGEILIEGTVIGEVISSAWTWEAEGEILVEGDISGSVISSAWTWEAEGEILVTDELHANVGYTFVSAGGSVTIGGGYLSQNDFESDGEITIGGGIDTPFVSDIILDTTGGIEIAGDAHIFFGDFGDLETMTEFITEIDEIQILFSDVPLDTTPFPSDTVDACGCADLPLVIDLKNNIAQNNKLSRFLTRNNLRFPTSFPMRYSEVSDSWQSNFHYRGKSSTGEGLETWNMTFEVVCTSTIGGSTLGKSFFSFGMYLSQIVGGADFDTRILVSFDPLQICSLSRDMIFKISVDSLFKTSTIDPEATVQNTVFYDNIGMFKTKFWSENPTVVFDVSEVGTPRPVRRINLTPTLEF